LSYRATAGTVVVPKNLRIAGKTERCWPRAAERVRWGGCDGTLTIIKENSPTSFAVEQNLETMRTAKTMTLDGKTNHILLIAAEFGQPATPPAPGGRGGRGQMIPDSFSILVVGK
jgi:hypothetical protein